ncbi:hypothetical protein SAMN06296386_11437 [Lachnospiraceae bacterium]|nr:hypothetical protein SAMN06296386_11437 [Lachnospiraceae bacterium]
MAPRAVKAEAKTETKAAVKPAAEKKAPAKKPEAKKTTTAKKQVKIEAELQFEGKTVTQEVLLQRIYDAWEATGHDKDAVKSLSIYLKPAEDRAYYVINGEENGSILMF